MSREAFRLLLNRYLEGKCTDEEKRIVKELYGIMDKQELEEIGLDEFNTIEQKLWERIHVNISAPEKEIQPSAPEKRKWQFSVRKWTGIAAAVAGFMLITGYLLLKQETRVPEFMTKKAFHGIREFVNHSGISKKVEFEDGSFVVLEPNAIIRYPDHFSRALREVTLEGEGFFQISKDAARPFLVYNKDVITKVLGTSFTIKAKARSGTEVSVRTGRVLVSPVLGRLDLVQEIIGDRTEVVLTPNQKTVFTAADKTFKQTLVSNPEPLSTEQGNNEKTEEYFSFNDAPLTEVIGCLEKSYGIAFTIENAELLHNTFTGDLSGQSLFNKLDFLCESVKAKYEISGTTIIIKRKNSKQPLLLK